MSYGADQASAQPFSRSGPGGGRNSGVAAMVSRLSSVKGLDFSTSSTSPSASNCPLSTRSMRSFMKVIQFSLVETMATQGRATLFETSGMASRKAGSGTTQKSRSISFSWNTRFLSRRTSTICSSSFSMNLAFAMMKLYVVALAASGSAVAEQTARDLLEKTTRDAGLASLTPLEARAELLDTTAVLQVCKFTVLVQAAIGVCGG
mmetsp:Transcript_3871/g.13734  ORF Transcript_3871/g.13734 Transcript_3871/m.13734 type:complete len:205 (-) Transcript_3871:124-738(-)